MSSLTRMLTGGLDHLRLRLAGILGRHPTRADGGVVACATNEGDHEDADHLQDVPDGAGCAEIWEHLSSDREQELGNGGG